MNAVSEKDVEGGRGRANRASERKNAERGRWEWEGVVVVDSKQTIGSASFSIRGRNREADLRTEKNAATALFNMLVFALYSASSWWGNCKFRCVQRALDLGEYYRDSNRLSCSYYIYGLAMKSY
jgi:hypothetical protein